jgi:hypothetical protein
MNRTTTIGLVTVFGLLLLYVLLIQRPREAAQGTPTPGLSRRTLFETQADQIVEMWIVDQVQNRGVALARDAQGTWTIKHPEARAADPGRAANATFDFANLSVSTTLTNPADLDGFGVLSPSYALGVKLADGSQLQASVGDKTPTGTGYYVRRDGEADVLVVSSGSLDALAALIESPPYFVPTATPSPTVDLAATLAAPTVPVTETPAPASSATAAP